MPGHSYMHKHACILPKLYKILSKSISITNYIFKYFFCQLLWTSSPKCKTILKVLTKLIDLKNTFVRHCESINPPIFV